jgi:adenylate cyclase
MAKDRLSDKLAVILHADVAGSTQLVQQDEHLAHERIQDSFHRFRDSIEKYRGKVLELRGDALLAEFERASDAVTATLAFQSDQVYYLSRLKDGLKPSIRVGIAMGEVVMGDGTVTGAGVVLAQRVEQLSEPGGLCITAALHETLPQRMPFDQEDLGEQELKGFDEKIRVYRVELRSGESVPSPQQQGQQRPTKSWRMMGIVGMVVLLVAGGGTYWSKYYIPKEEPASLERMAFPLPDKPSIAVLPFTNMSDDPKQEYFADGMTEDLITDLSKISGLFVIARNSSFSYKNQQVTVRQVAEELGVRYIIEGSVRRAGNQVRINAQLIDATTGGHLWAERYDGSLADIFALQDQVTTKIVGAMSITLTPQELEVLESFGTSNAAAHDAYLQGLSFYLRNTPADNAKAEPHFKRALELDPEFKRAYAALAGVYYKGTSREYSFLLGFHMSEAIFLAHQNLAKSVGANIAETHVVRSRMALKKHQHGVALREAEQALILSRNNVDALKVKARAMIYSGRYEEGRKLANQIIRLDPAVLAEPLFLIGLSYFASGSYDKAVDYAEQATENDPATRAYALLLAAAYGKLGMEKPANESLAKYRKSWPWPFWIAAAVYQYPFQDGEILKHLADGFNAAGLAERPPSRYLKLNRETRLSGKEIEELLFGHTIKGQDFWWGLAWEQIRTIDGKLSHSGRSIYAARSEREGGESWIEDDRLCNLWSDLGDEITICVLIFRDLDRGPNNYYMVTDQGPHPFQVEN